MACLEKWIRPGGPLGRRILVNPCQVCEDSVSGRECQRNCHSDERVVLGPQTLGSLWPDCPWSRFWRRWTRHQAARFDLRQACCAPEDSSSRQGECRAEKERDHQAQQTHWHTQDDHRWVDRSAGKESRGKASQRGRVQDWKRETHSRRTISGLHRLAPDSRGKKIQASEPRCASRWASWDHPEGRAKQGRPQCCRGRAIWMQSGPSQTHQRQAVSGSQTAADCGRQQVAEVWCCIPDRRACCCCRSTAVWCSRHHQPESSGEAGTRHLWAAKWSQDQDGCAQSPVRPPAARWTQSEESCVQSLICLSTALSHKQKLHMLFACSNSQHHFGLLIQNWKKKKKSNQMFLACKIQISQPQQRTFSDRCSKFPSELYYKSSILDLQQTDKIMAWFKITWNMKELLDSHKSNNDFRKESTHLSNFSEKILQTLSLQYRYFFGVPKLFWLCSSEKKKKKTKKLSNRTNVHTVFWCRSYTWVETNDVNIIGRNRLKVDFVRNRFDLIRFEMINSNEVSSFVIQILFVMIWLWSRITSFLDGVFFLCAGKAGFSEKFVSSCEILRFRTCWAFQVFVEGQKGRQFSVVGMGLEREGCCPSVYSWVPSAAMKTHFVAHCIGHFCEESRQGANPIAPDWHIIESRSPQTRLENSFRKKNVNPRRKRELKSWHVAVLILQMTSP